MGTAGSGEVSGYDSGGLNAIWSDETGGVDNYGSGGVNASYTGEMSDMESEGLIAGDNGEVTSVNSIKLSWMTPMSNADGSSLTDLGGYRIYYRKLYVIAQTCSMGVGYETSATNDNLLTGIRCIVIKVNDIIIEYTITQIYSLDVGIVTSATIDNLTPGIWCFTIRAYNDSNIESELSNYVCKEI